MAGALEQALLEVLDEPVTVTGASRTDAGVHALGQVASVRIAAPVPAERLPRALNARLPSGVAVRAAEEVDGDFHARFDATGKVYRYHIATGEARGALVDRYAWHCPYELDLDRMRAGAAHLLGEHDFRGFERQADADEPSVRCVRRVEMIEGLSLVCLGPGAPPGVLAVEIEGDAFVWNMVRNVAGTLVEVGRGKRAPEDVARIVREQDRPLAGPTLPARGLVLVRVLYDGERRRRGATTRPARQQLTETKR